jgi:hypothetical protein
VEKISRKGAKGIPVDKIENQNRKGAKKTQLTESKNTIIDEQRTTSN